MKKKVIIVDNSTWNIYNFRLPLIRRLKAAGYRVVVLAPVDEYIHYINDSYFTKHISLRHLRPQSKNPFWDALLFWELYKLYRREQPDLIIHYTIKPNIFGNLAARWAGFPAISTVTGLGYSFLHKGLVNWAVPKLYKWAFREVRKVVFYNTEDRALFIKRRLIDAKRAEIVPGSGVNTNHFRPLNVPHRNKFIFLFIGRLLYDKGLAEFVAAAGQIRALSRSIECWVVGELTAGNPAAVPKEQMLEWMKEKNIRYFGSADDVRQYIKQCDAVVLPSYREGVPRALLEAMAMAKPIIATAVPGCSDTTEEGQNGFLVPSHDAEALAEAMLRLYHLDEDELQRMGRYSRQKVLAQFDDKIIAERFFSLIEAQLITHRPTVLSPQSAVY